MATRFPAYIFSTSPTCYTFIYVVPELACTWNTSYYSPPTHDLSTQKWVAAPSRLSFDLLVTSSFFPLFLCFLSPAILLLLPPHSTAGRLMQHFQPEGYEYTQEIIISEGGSKDNNGLNERNYWDRGMKKRWRKNKGENKSGSQITWLLGCGTLATDGEKWNF